MDDTLSRGDLAHVPFAQALAEAGRQKLTGHLVVRRPGGGKTFSFERGALVLESGSFDEAAFLHFLLTSGEADLIGLSGVEDHALRNGTSLLRALSEAAHLEPPRLWPSLESFLKEEAFSLFDVEEGEFEFRELAALSGRTLIAGLDVPGLILEGVRRMTNSALISRNLPAEDESLRRLPSAWAGTPALLLHERYVLGLLDAGTTLGELYAASDIATAESRKILFALISLGLAGTAAPKPKTGRLPADRSPAGMDKLFAHFNGKCSFIFKYISKGVGPVALSIIQKSLDEIRGRLDPVFQELVLQPDGRIELKSSLRVNLTIGGEESRRSFLRSMDEILMAEVLAVKRTLGPSHEAALVRSLEKMGEGA